MPFEIPIWEAWLISHREDYDRFVYDVRVGESIIPPPDVDANIADMAVSLAKKRIDVVAYKADQPTVIEIKLYAGLTAIGQLVTYPILFALEFPEVPKPRVLLVAARMLPDVATILDVFQIPYDVVTV